MVVSQEVTQERDRHLQDKKRRVMMGNVINSIQGKVQTRADAVRGSDEKQQ